MKNKGVNIFISNLNNDAIRFPDQDCKKKRICLMCNQLFVSKGFHNRRCSKCSRLLFLRGNNAILQPHYKCAFNTPNPVVNSDKNELIDYGD